MFIQLSEDESETSDVTASSYLDHNTATGHSSLRRRASMFSRPGNQGIDDRRDFKTLLYPCTVYERAA